MNVTKRRCTNCEGEGALVDVVKYGGETEKGLPASAAAEAVRDRPDEGEPDYYAIKEASAPYPCDLCRGPGFYFYLEDEARFGESIRLDELPSDAVVIRVKGTPEWNEQHEGQPADFIWKPVTTSESN